MTDRRREAHEEIDRAEHEEARRVRERVARDVEPASQGPIGPADVAGGPVPEPLEGTPHADSDAAGVPGVPEERVRKGGLG
ncbi:MAG TPA: hypothetical protein VF406_17020 [Thermodesulfobacteriota bacterium]